jgi:undecaprenyl phosphate N,N'-diacetylbacillosamine 1-phosphate transferase
MIYQGLLKRLLDFIFSGFLILLFSPLIILTAIGLRLYNGRSGIFFLQVRPGRNERLFKVIKFKTMNEKRDAQGNLLPSFDRITPFGAYVRKYSIDELPQLFNVFIGDMSLVGPRPLLVQYLGLYSEVQSKRHDVRPGITGWAQVNGRNSISWKRKFELDVYYVNNISLAFDLRILWKTFIKVLKGSGVNASDSRTVQTFNGQN